MTHYGPDHIWHAWFPQAFAIHRGTYIGAPIFHAGFAIILAYTFADYLIGRRVPSRFVVGSRSPCPFHAVFDTDVIVSVVASTILLESFSLNLPCR